MLVLAAAAACGADIDDGGDGLADIATAFELVHAYSLVHDDLPSMDDDDLRRGMPTSHRQFGEGVAVLVGDALQAEAFALVARADFGSADQRLRVSSLLATAAGWTGMVGGQYMDIAQVRDADDVDALRRLHARKTGALIEASVTAGAVLGGAHGSDLDSFGELGRGLGWLFQLVDDLLDAVGDSDITGKAAGQDQRLSRVTGIDVFGIDGLRAAADEQLDACIDVAATLPRGGGLLPDIARYVRNRDR